MKKILMVCLGNICRSPMAEGILKNRLREAGILAEVDSAGISDWHQGEPPDARAVEECKKHGVDISGQRSRPFKAKDFDAFDLIYAMDEDNFRSLMREARESWQKDKIRMIMNEVNPGKDIPVPDPYYGGPKGFSSVYAMLDKAALRIAVACREVI